MNKMTHHQKLCWKKQQNKSQIAHNKGLNPILSVTVHDIPLDIFCMMFSFSYGISSLSNRLFNQSSGKRTTHTRFCLNQMK